MLDKGGGGSEKSLFGQTSLIDDPLITSLDFIMNDVKRLNTIDALNLLQLNKPQWMLFSILGSVNIRLLLFSLRFTCKSHLFFYYYLDINIVHRLVGPRSCC